MLEFAKSSPSQLMLRHSLCRFNNIGRFSISSSIEGLKTCLLSEDFTGWMRVNFVIALSKSVPNDSDIEYEKF